MIKRYKYLIFLVLVAIVLTGCTSGGGGGGGTPGVGGIAAYVRFSPSGEPVPGAYVEVVSSYGAKLGDGRTRGDGYFEISNIRAGTHTLIVEHPDITYRTDSQSVTIPSNGVNRKEVIVPRSSKPVVDGKGYYVVIGVDYPEGPSRTSPRADARAVYEDLFHSNQLAGMGRLLVRNGGEGTREPTKTNIKNSIDEAIELADGRDDYLVIYFSGDSGRNYLKDRDGRWITDGELEGWVRKFPGPVTLVFDGNESFSMVDGEVLPQAFKKWDYTVLGGSLHKQDSGATEWSDFSWFTYHLLEGIRWREADYNRDGDITASELFDYIALAMGVDSSQTPFLKPGNYANSVIYRYKR